MRSSDRYLINSLTFSGPTDFFSSSTNLNKDPYFFQVDKLFNFFCLTLYFYPLYLIRCINPFLLMINYYYHPCLFSSYMSSYKTDFNNRIFMCPKKLFNFLYKMLLFLFIYSLALTCSLIIYVNPNLCYPLQSALSFLVCIHYSLVADAWMQPHINGRISICARWFAFTIDRYLLSTSVSIRYLPSSGYKWL